MSFAVMSSSLGPIRSSRSTSSSLLINSKLSRYYVQRRTFWRWTSRDRSACNDVDRILNRMHEYQRHYLSVPHRKASGNDRQQWIGSLYNRRPWQGCQWNTSSGSGLRGPCRRLQDTKDPWEIHRARTQRKMEHIKKQVEEDPYTALFGRRLDPFDYWDVRHGSWSDFWRAFWGLDHGSKPYGSTTTSARSKPDKDTRIPDLWNKGNEDELLSTGVSAGRKGINHPQQTATRAGTEIFEFDPVSGRMVPVTPHALDAMGRIEHRPRSKPGETTGEKEGGLDDRVRTVNEIIEEQPYSKDVRSLKSESLPESIVVAPPTHQSEVGPSELAESYGNQPENVQERNSTTDTLGYSVFPVTKPLEASQNSETSDKTRKNREEGSSKIPTHEYEKLLENLRGREKNEDLDLLRASDIRAPYDSKKGKPDADVLKQHRQKALEQDFDSYKDTANGVYTEDIRAGFQDHDNSKTEGEKAHGPHILTGTEQLPAQIVGSATNIGQKETGLETENDLKLESSRVDESDAAEAHQPLVQNMATSKSDQDQHPVRDEEVTEPSKSSNQQVDLDDFTSASPPFVPATYRVLAYDSSARQITAAETTSSLYTNEASHPTEILSQLNNPAKFLPRFAEMKRDGYEIVSGGGDILVFKKMREEEDTPVATAASTFPHSTQNLPGDSIKKEEHTSELEPGDRPQYNNEPSTENQTRLVQRQETAYTDAPPNRSSYPPSPPSPDENNPETSQTIPKGGGGFRKALNRMLLTGTATAATCYAVGVVCEYFRTGGEDGRGIDAFTVLESERRQRERG